MTTNSKQLARKWPYPRHRNFVRDLRNAAASWFKGKGFSTHPKMSYCLEKWVDWPRNIILPEVSDYIQSFKDKCEKQDKPFPLHKYIHHGLSSQAMAFNIIGPLITRDDYRPLQHVLEKLDVLSPSDKIASAEFEYEDREVFNEDSGQPTSIDIVLKNTDGRRIFFIESKLVEQEFGGCSVFEKGDCDGRNPISHKKQCYLHFIGRRYWDLIEKHGFSENLKAEKQCVFAAHYQFFREVLFSLEKGGMFILLSDERSPVFHCKSEGAERGLMPFLLEFVPESYKDRIASISVQSLVNAIKESPGHEDWIGEFEKKYGIEQT